MSHFAKGLQALDDPRNEPIKWLLADALQHHAEATNGPHFLLEALAQPSRSGRESSEKCLHATADGRQQLGVHV
jgi:hypothetical protein